MKKLIVLFNGLLLTLTQYAQPTFFGMTSGGGQYSAGTIFKTDGSGTNQTVSHSFFKIDGASPGCTNLIQASDGNLYGMTNTGGTFGKGVLFTYNPSTNNFDKKVDFDGINGEYPNGSLIQASNGNLYGMTTGGGTNYLGVLFQYNPTTNIYTKILDFNGASNGGTPYGSLMQASDGNLYGTTYVGGTNDLGVLFAYNPSTNIYTKKFDFDGTTNGSYPKCSIIQASDGNLYGVTSAGGTNESGVLFAYNPSTNTYTNMFDFIGINGSFPYGSLMQASDGNLYGMTNNGGTNSLGVLFAYNPSTIIYTKKLDFDGATNGGIPFGSLIQASNGNIYGMTRIGGTNDLGVLFAYNPSTDIYTKTLDFADTSNGSHPLGSLMQASDGNLYGMTHDGGANLGVLFAYNPSANTYIKKLNFGTIANGGYPQGSLVQASDGNLYGMGSCCGANGLGVLFQYNPTTNIYTKILDFDGATNGGTPYGSLMQASDGNLYGMTSSGGANNWGVLFAYNPSTNTFTKKLDFDGATNGGNPFGSLMQASDGNLYGMTTFGGINYSGVLFAYNPGTNTYTKKLDFNGANSGGYPKGYLVQAIDGNLYGMTTSGGIYDYGVLFQYNPTTNIYTKKFDFNGTTNGGLPYGSLIQASDGNLYGNTYRGGTNNWGVLFAYNPTTNIYTKKLDFSGLNGIFPLGSLMQSSNGNLYGVTNSGGTNGSGVIFQYNPSTNIYTKTLDFNGFNGANPGYLNLIEVNATPTGIQSLISDEQSLFSIYPNPTSTVLNLELLRFGNGTDKIEVLNTLGQVVITEIATTKNLSLKTQNLPNGIYFIKVSNTKYKYYVVQFKHSKM